MGDITRGRLRRWLFSLVWLALAASLSAQIRLESVATGVAGCTGIHSPLDGSGRLFLVRQAGTIQILRNGAVGGTPFLDIRERITTGGERGLLGLAFPPNYKDKGWFYVNYTDRGGNTVVSRFQLLNNNQERADPASERILLTVPQPFANHNGGQLQFGPDGMMYIGMGDGGSANDPQGNGQNPRALLGKMLRIDTESNPGRYEIPASNPFVGDARYAPEIWALGMRNPWRFSFDRGTGDLYMADVGQDAFEEIDFQPRASRGGENYGWVTVEGRTCVRAGCNQTGLTAPVWVYPHSQGASVTGGYVYRGAASPALVGTYVYGDFTSGRIWGLRREGTEWTNQLLLNQGNSFGISTFGEDEAGELYVANHSSGEIFRIVGLPSVVSAASFEAGLTPGGLATVFASGILDSDQTLVAGGLPLPRVLGDVRVRVNGADAPLLAVVRNGATQQVNFQAPWDLQAGTNARVQIVARGLDGEVLSIPVRAVQPGIFALSAAGAVLIRARDFSVVDAGSAIARGEDYVLYASGLGMLGSTVAAGEALNEASPIRGGASLSLGGAAAQILYAGAAPGFVGVYQVNFRPGASTPAGSHDLVLTVDQSVSPVRKVLVAP